MTRLVLVVLVVAACSKDGTKARAPITQPEEAREPSAYVTPTVYADGTVAHAPGTPEPPRVAAQPDPVIPDAAPPPPPETKAEKRARLAAEAKEAREQAAEERRAAREQAAADKAAAREQAAADRAAAREAAARARAEEKEGAEWVEREMTKLAIRQSAPAQFRQWAAQANVPVDFSTRGPYEMILVVHGDACDEDSLGKFARDAKDLLATAGFMSIECAGGPSISLAH